MSKFIENEKYAGEQFFGGCGCMDTRSITVLERKGDTIVYEEKAGNTTISTGEAKILVIEKWGEYIATNEDRFFAYAVYG